MTVKRIHRVRQRNISVRSFTIGSTKRADTSRQITEEDAFTTTGIGKAALLPPYNPQFLAQCVERSNMLKQCIAAMVTNVGMVGFEVAPTDRAVEVDDAEREELQSFIDACNSEESLTSVHTKAVDDYETYGYCFLEAIRDRKGRISLLRHMPAFSTRLLPKDQEPELVEYEVSRGRRTTTVQEYRTFRRFVQIVNGKTRYFREFGDQRVLNMETGEYGTCPVAIRATEVIHVRQNSNDPYGVPRWINQLPSILGSREAEECNLRYFEDNTIPPMILSVAGGRLTSQSYKELKDILLKQGIGVDRQNKMILIEAVAEREGLDEKGSTVTLKIDKLTDARQSDGLFSQAQEMLINSDWPGAIDTLLKLRKDDPSYQSVKIDGMLFIALRNRGLDKIAKQADLEGGLYDLSQAERFGPLDSEAQGYINWVSLYITGASFWELDWQKAVEYFSQVGPALPGLRDRSGLTAQERYRLALKGYGETLAAAGDYCGAADQFQLSLSIGTDPEVEALFNEAYSTCQGGSVEEQPSEQPPAVSTEITPPLRQPFGNQVPLSS